MPTATKLKPTKLLSELADSQSSGCLTLDTGLVSWEIYLKQGHLQYVYCSAQLLDQLTYHLHCCGLKQGMLALKHLPPSFTKLSSIQNKSPSQNIYSKVILWLLREQHLNLSQGFQLIATLIKDELQSCLWLDRGTSSWQTGDLTPNWIPPQIKSSLLFSISECLNDGQIKLRQWQNCSKEMVSVHQRPYFPPSWETKNLPANGSLNRKTLIELTKVLKGRTSIRQLSILLNKDELQVAQILSPYADEKIIYLHHAQAPLDKLPHISKKLRETYRSLATDEDEDDITQGYAARGTVNASKEKVKNYKIVCIDDSPTILSEIQRFLDRKSFEVIAIDDPVQAVSQIFKIGPDLILLDITMPRINGYKLCGLLRSSGNCNDVPIIMVSGNTGLIDKARAKLSGATDYFTKPFTKEGLNQIVTKYLP